MIEQGNWVRLASLTELKENRRLVLTLNETEILLLLVGGEPQAVKNYCTHLGKPLDKGRIMAGQLHCPFHGACFDLKSGEALSGPAVTPLTRYTIKVEGDDIFIELP